MLTTIDHTRTAKVFALEEAIRRDLSEYLVTLHVEHTIAGGVYCRQLEIPAGTVLTGHIHRREHIAMVVKGVIDVYDGDGPPKTLRAPCIFVSQPGIKRAGFAITDTIFVTVHRLDDPDEQDLDKIEHECVCTTMEEYEKSHSDADTHPARARAISAETPMQNERLEMTPPLAVADAIDSRKMDAVSERESVDIQGR